MDTLRPEDVVTASGFILVAVVMVVVVVVVGGDDKAAVEYAKVHPMTKVRFYFKKLLNAASEYSNTQAGKRES